MFEKYKEIAIKLLGKITNSEERKDCFIFYNDEIKEDGCIVVLKGSKKILTMAQYVMR